MRKDISIALVATLLLCFPSVGTTQRQQKPGSFYKGDFASDPLGSERRREKEEDSFAVNPDAKPAKNALSEGRKGFLPDRAGIFDDEKRTEKMVDPVGQAKQEVVGAPERKGVSFDKPGVPVKAVSVILPDDVSKKQGKRSLDRFLELATQQSLAIDTIYVASKFPELSQQDNMKLWALNAKVRSTISLPPQYAEIKTMPTWIVTVDEGEVILEGYDLSREDFNSKGEILVRDVIERFAPELLKNEE
jgi:hypothetical protein